MKMFIKVAAAMAMLASVPTTAMAQGHSDRSDRGQMRGSQQARQAPAHRYREVTASSGHRFRRGQRLTANQRRYVVNDWNQRGLRSPPRGYYWVRENNNSGDYLLVAVASGLISSILSQ